VACSAMSALHPVATIAPGRCGNVTTEPSARSTHRSSVGRLGGCDDDEWRAAMAFNQLGIIAAPPQLGLVHDLTGGYAALWGCVVAALALAYAVTRIAAK
jgi:hypothetical protein